MGADPIGLLRDRHETDLVGVARDVTGVCEVVGNRASVESFERAAIPLEKALYARCSLPLHYSPRKESRVCLTDRA